MSRALRAVREPLVPFLLLGALLFVLDALLGRGGDDEIVVTAGRVQGLRESFELVWQRPPTEAELRGLIEDYVREEVFYREAIALGLDQDDSFIRRRLREKMQFLAFDSIEVAEPTHEDLKPVREGSAGGGARDELRREWIASRRREAMEAFYRTIREKYRVTVELDGWERER